MLKRTHRIKPEKNENPNKFFNDKKETLEELLIRLDVKKCISRPCTPEKVNPKFGAL